MVIANASVTYNIFFALALSASVGYSGDWTVPLTAHVGRLGAGAYAERYSWSFGRYVLCVGGHRLRRHHGPVPHALHRERVRVRTGPAAGLVLDPQAYSPDE